jgi:hypothetical protein
MRLPSNTNNLLLKQQQVNTSINRGLFFILLMVLYYHLSNKMEMRMARRERAEGVFRRLSVENRGLLLTYFETALEAENSVKRALGISVLAGQGLAGPGRAGDAGTEETPGKTSGPEAGNRASGD